MAIKQQEDKKIIRVEKRQWEKSDIQDIEKNFKRNLQISYKKTNDIKNKYKQRTAIMKESDGTLITNKRKIAEKFRRMFQIILLKRRQEVCRTTHDNSSTTKKMNQ